MAIYKNGNTAKHTNAFVAPSSVAGSLDDADDPLALNDPWAACLGGPDAMVVLLAPPTDKPETTTTIGLQEARGTSSKLFSTQYSDTLEARIRDFEAVPPHYTATLESLVAAQNNTIAVLAGSWNGPGRSRGPARQMTPLWVVGWTR